jgi:hypothetical protein
MYGWPAQLSVKLENKPTKQNICVRILAPLTVHASNAVFEMVLGFGARDVRQI